jgi:hypothetical protein
MYMCMFRSYCEFNSNSSHDITMNNMDYMNVYINLYICIYMHPSKNINIHTYGYIHMYS